MFPTYRSFKYLLFVCSSASLGAINVGIFYNILNACMHQLIDLFHWDDLQSRINIGLLSALIPMGVIVGGFFGGFLSDCCGRRKTLMLADIITIIGAIMTLSTNFHTLSIGRLICGIGCGFNFNVIPVYIREMSPSEISGELGGSFKFGYCAGMLIVFLQALILPLPNNNITNDTILRIMFITPSIIASIRLTIFLLFIKLDTPKYYVLTNENDKLTEVLKKIYHLKYINDIYIKEKKSLILKTMSDVCSPKFKRQFILCIGLYNLVAFLGYYAVTFYSTDIFLGIQDDPNNFDFEARILNTAMAFIKLICAFFGGYIADRSGRRSLILGGNAVITLALWLFVISGFFNCGICQCIAIFIYTIAFGLSFSIVLPVYASELLSAKGVGLVVMWDGVCTVFIAFIYPLLAYSSEPESITYVFIFFAICALIANPLLKAYVKETKDRSIHDIYKMFHSSGLVNQVGLLDDDISPSLSFSDDDKENSKIMSDIPVIPCTI